MKALMTIHLSRGLRAAGALICALLATTSAQAQCAMCRASIAGSENPGALSDTLNLAILALFIPTIMIIGAIGAIVIRHLRADHLAMQASSPTRREDLPAPDEPDEGEGLSGRRPRSPEIWSNG
jgi:hypothetical protein